MHQKKIDLLTRLAQEKMVLSHDPLHGVEHVERVVKHVKRIANSLNLSQTEKEALILAAWWHDSSRTIIKRTSYIVMPFIDDILSSLMLWYYTCKYRLFGKVVGISTRLILCKSLGTGKILNKILLRKKDRQLLSILKDADGLDLLHIERMKKNLSLLEKSSIKRFGYKSMVWWPLIHSQLQVHSYAAQEVAESKLQEYTNWIQTDTISMWHKERFGNLWHEKHVERSKNLLHEVRFLSINE